MIARGARILAVLAAAGHDPAWLQRTARLGTDTIARLLDDARQTPSAATLDAVARTAGVTAAWLDPDGARRELTATAAAEVRRCARVLRGVARGERIDARRIPNVRPEPARRVPHSFRVHGARQVYRVLGDSLVHAGLLDGDLAYVRPADRVRDVVGALVVVHVNGMSYLKRLTVAQGGVVVLSSAAEGYEPILIGAEDGFVLLGEVVACVRECWRA
ncbi:MAG TPA: S24 family peptidase [Thermoanaerobaculia bacterium]